RALRRVRALRGRPLLRATARGRDRRRRAGPRADGVPAPRRTLRGPHLLRGRLSGAHPALRRGRRRLPGQRDQRRLVRPHVGALPAPRAGHAAGGGEPGAARARRQHRHLRRRRARRPHPLAGAARPGARARRRDRLAGGAHDFWKDAEKAQAVGREAADVRDAIDRWRRQREGVDEAQVFLELAEEGAPDALGELITKVEEVEHGLAELELRRLLGGEHDAGNAIVEIHPGAGGLEAQDWAEMLLRLYLRWCERRGFRAELVEFQPGEGAGLKSATFTVEGSYAYGYLKAEAGIHRLVRISPFDANARRHTSFASVFVFPDIEEEIQIDVRDED